jgi:hypothetical protein
MRPTGVALRRERVERTTGGCSSWPHVVGPRVQIVDVLAYGVAPLGVETGELSVFHGRETVDRVGSPRYREVAEDPRV